jgi:hypothetical protein
MKAYTMILAVVATVAFPGLLMAENSNANIAANEAVQMNDAEMDNVTAAGLGLGKEHAPGQQMKQLLLARSPVQCDHGNSCNAPGKIFGGAKNFAPGRIGK